MAGLVISPRARIFHGHDWVYAGEIKKAFGEPKDGDVISLKDFRDRPLGSAIFNSKSQIVARRFSRQRQDLDLEFFKRRIAQAIDYRKRRGVNPDFCRLVWSESDGLPGLIVDRHRDCLVVQTLTLAMDLRLPLIVEALRETTQPMTIIERNDAPVRRAEGMELRTGVRWIASSARDANPTGEAANLIASGDLDLSSRPGSPAPRPPLFPSAASEVTIHPIEMEFLGVKFSIDPLHGQKTGFYYDQIDNYREVALCAPGRRVLDCFSHEGAFALTCARAGASEVTAVEISADSASRLKANAERNGLAVRTVEENAFDFLSREEQRGAQYDLIVLDPPSFTKSRERLGDAMRGYKEIHIRAFKLLSPAGQLATFSCSHHVSGALFKEMINDALVDAKKSARQLKTLHQAADHPILVTQPETEYLKGFLLELAPGR